MGTGSVSTVTGLLNFSTYIGSAASTYLFAVVSDNYGWSATIFIWLSFAAVGAVITMFIDAKFKNKKFI